MNLKDYERALEYYLEALSTKEETNDGSQLDRMLMASYCYEISELYSKLGEHELAKKYKKRAKKLKGFIIGTL